MNDVLYNETSHKIIPPSSKKGIKCWILSKPLAVCQWEAVDKRRFPIVYAKKPSKLKSSKEIPHFG